MKKLSKKALNQAWLRWNQHSLTSMSFDRLEAFGFCHSMLPIINELYKDKPDELQKAIKRHASFYNTEPQIGSLVNGIVAGMEEQRANGQPIDDTTISSIKVGLMGPIAGIGDSMIPGTLIPILLSIGIMLSNGGSPMGAIFYIFTYITIMIIMTRKVYFMGYNMGINAVALFTSEKSLRIREGITRIGILIMGGLAAAFVNLSTTLQFKQDNVDIKVQTLIDNVFPKLLPLLVTMLVYYLMAKKRFTPIKMMLTIFAVVIVGCLLNIF